MQKGPRPSFHPLRLPILSSKRKNQPERLKQISDVNSLYLLSAIGLYGLALPLVDKWRTNITPPEQCVSISPPPPPAHPSSAFAAQNIPPVKISLSYQDLSFWEAARFFWSPFADQPADNCVHEYDYRYLFLRISLFSVVSMSGCPAASVFSCLTKRGHNVCCYLKKGKPQKKKQCLYKNGMRSYFPSSCFWIELLFF